MKLSVVAPAHNEAESLPELFREVLGVFDEMGYRTAEDAEIIIIDDGSRDSTFAEVKHWAGRDRRVRGLRFKFNAGQTAAMAAGFATAKGDAIIAIDADLQNDPADIPKLVLKLDEGYDCVSGWRKDRKDAAATRNIPSRIGNWVIARTTGLGLKDLGCSLKAYRREAIQAVPLYGEMHRFIPALIHQQGGKVTELAVNHRARQHGRTHYSVWKTFRVLLDLLVVKFMGTYLRRPIHFFGGLGFMAGFLGVVFLVASVALKVTGMRDFVETPLPVWSGALIILAVQMITIGVLSEVISRLYFRTPGASPHLIAEEADADSVR